MPFDLKPEYVTKTENALGVRFPTTFVEAMLLDNGGAVRWGEDCIAWLHPFSDESSKKRLVRTCNDIVRETKQARTWPGFPEAAICIGQCDADRLVFLPDEGDPSLLAAPVWFFDHETGELIEIAEDFANLEKSKG